MMCRPIRVRGMIRTNHVIFIKHLSAHLHLHKSPIHLNNNLTFCIYTQKLHQTQTHFPLKIISSKPMPILSTVIKFRVKCFVFILDFAFYLEDINLVFLVFTRSCLILTLDFYSGWDPAVGMII